MKPVLLLAHGWGLGPGSWRQLRSALTSTETNALDFGFFGPAAIPEIKDRPAIGIGHSLGFLWLLNNYNNYNFLGLISINGFARFSAADDFPGTGKKVLQRMISKTGVAPKKVLEDFRKQAAAPPCKTPPLEKININALIEGLSWLRDWDRREALSRAEIPVLALAAEDDAIVSPAATKASFGKARQAKIAWSETGGHALLLNKPEWCAKKIQYFMEIINDGE